MQGQRIGQYRVIESLGTGGMGRVYRAVDELLGREAALKILDTSMEDSAARLRAEAAALARLSHPGIATVYELIEDSERLVMAMELVRGKTLQQLLEQVGVFSPRRAAELCMQALAALEEAHAAGIIHRDLKPANLMLTDRGSIKVMDFGIARLKGSISLTSAGSMLGTPAYMAPEQVLGQPIDPRTDVYAMGIVFFRLITGALPFKGETPFEMAQAQVNAAPAAAGEIRAGVPSWVDDIVGRALAKKPADRFQSSVEFREALARAIAASAEPQVAAAVEATEVMSRPDASDTAHDAEPGTPSDQDARPFVINGWFVLAAGLVLAAGVWLFNPFGGASPDTAPDQTSASAEPPPSAPVADPASTAAATVPIAKPTPPAVSTPVPVADKEAAPVVPARAAASFTDVKSLAVNGTRTSTSDVAVEFGDEEFTVQARDNKTPAMVLPYKGFAKATYVRGRDPKWDPALSGPAGKIDVPGILGRARHWLVLQGPDRYLILRLDGDDRLEVLKAFEERAGIVVDRSGGKEQ